MYRRMLRKPIIWKQRDYINSYCTMPRLQTTVFVNHAWPQCFWTLSGYSVSGLGLVTVFLGHAWPHCFWAMPGHSVSGSCLATVFLGHAWPQSFWAMVNQCFWAVAKRICPCILPHSLMSLHDQFSLNRAQMHHLYDSCLIYTQSCYLKTLACDLLTP